MQQECVREFGHTQNPCRPVSIEQVYNMDIEIPLQPFGVHLCSVHDFYDVGITDDFL